MVVKLNGNFNLEDHVIIIENLDRYIGHPNIKFPGRQQ
jgi:hypothetical protein